MQNLITELKNLGLMVDSPKLDGTIKRCGTESNPKGKNGWYIGWQKFINEKEFISCAIGDWTQGNDALVTYKSWENDNSLSAFARDEIQKHQAAMQKKAAAENVKRHQEAAKNATAEWNRLTDFVASQYLVEKGVNAYGTRYGTDKDGGYLAVPVRDFQSNLKSIQRIYDAKPTWANDRKFFLAGGEKKGFFHFIPPANGDYSVTLPFCFAEGYATAASIHEATGYLVVVCFDAGNIEPVVKAWREKYPTQPFLLCADNDQFKFKNTGVEKANAAAKLFSCSVAIPDFAGFDFTNTATDFNDLHQLAGLDHLRNVLMNPTLNPESQQKNDNKLFQIGVESFQEPITDNKEELDIKPSKVITINALLAHIAPINLRAVCEDLGWIGAEDKHPTQSDIAIAVVEVLLNTAKSQNWHLIHNAGYFYIYNAAYWVALEDKEVKHFLKNAAMKAGYAQIKSRSFHFVEKLFMQVQQDGFFTERTYRKQSIINLKNGSLVIGENGVMMKPFDYRDFLTHQLEFDYDETARNSVFERYLKEVLPDADTRKTLQQALGYVFTKGIKLEKIIFLYGLGANGKSVIFEILSGVIGEENVSNFSLESLTDNASYNRAMIKDKIVNYGTDIKISKVDPANLKTLASGEPIEARLPYRDPFMMTDYAKLIFNVNRLDSANIEHTHGFFRRLLIIPFCQTIAEHQQDVDLHHKILQDKAGVLNWMIEGAREVIKNRRIFISAECENHKKTFIKESDSVAMFEEQSIKENQPAYVNYMQTVGQSYIDYKTFCLDSGSKPLGKINFSKRMEALGFKKSKIEAGWYLEKNYSV